MIIGITGRGGTGKTTLAKDIVKNHKNFIHLEVDSIIDNELSNKKTLYERIKNETNKDYTFKQIRETFFKYDDTAKKIKTIFFEELHKIIKDKTKNKSKNYIIEHFLLKDYETIKLCDYKIKLIAPKEERIKRIKKRGNMSEELYNEVDKMYSDIDNNTYDLEFDIADYKKELISIIIPVYNAEKYIKETLNSVINQTYQNLEIIIVNDGSTDNTLNIINKYKKKDKRIKVITTENKNVSNARNTGLDNATGEYISFIDSDDLINKEYISCLYDAIKLKKADLTHSKIAIHREGDNGYISTRSNKLIDINNPINAYLTMDIKFSVWGKLFKKELINNIRFDNISRFEDFKFMWEVVKKTKYIVIVPDAQYEYIQRTKDSLTQKNYNKDNKKLIEHAYTVLKESKYSENGKRFFYGCLLFNVLMFIQSYNNNPEQVNQYKKEVFKCLYQMDKYKKYKFNILEFYDIDIDEVIKQTKEIVGINTIGIFWNSMELNMHDIEKTIKNNAIILKHMKLKLNADQLENFIRKVYPRLSKDKWKTDYKVKSMVNQYNSNNIDIMYFTLFKDNIVHIKRKNKDIYCIIEEFKDLIRNSYRDKVDKYKYDNIFHMTDDENEYYELTPLIEEYTLFNNNRKNSRIIINNKVKEVKNENGKRKLYKYKNWYIKEVRENSYEDYTEIFIEEIFRLFKVKKTFYDLGIINNKNCVISYNFKDNYKYINAANIISEVIQSNDINEIIKYNNINSLKPILIKYCKSHNMETDNIDEVIKELEKIMKIDIVLMQSDRNPYNYGFIIKNNHLELSRIFDNSNAFSSNHIEKDPTNNFPLLTIDKNSFTTFYNEIKNNLNYYKDINTYIDYINNNLEDIFILVENKIGDTIPQEYKIFVKKHLNNHFKIIKNIYNNNH